MSGRAAVIMSAGQGTRMKSPLPKVLHRVGGRAMLDRAIDAAEQLDCERIAVVCGTHSPAVAAHVTKRLGADAVAIQDPPLGTGHAVLCAKPALEGFNGDVLVMNADCPLLSAVDLEPLFNARAELALLGFMAADPARYGRLILDGERVEKIVEANDATPEQLAIKACYSGFMVAPTYRLWSWLAKVNNDNAKGEYYLTDIVALANAEKATVKAAFASEQSVMGADSQAGLAAAEAVFQAGRRTALMAEGVNMAAPETVHFAWDTEVEAGVVIEPYVVFGPGVRIDAEAVIRSFSHLEGCVVRTGAIVGPYARLRPGADIGEEAHIGNFVEVKKVKVGAGAKANHLSYLGDGSVGAKANIGAGTIFCNYDGFDKWETHVGEGAFIGSNTALVAPVKIGDGAMTGSGSVITEDVEADALALERSEQVQKKGWAARFRSHKRATRKK
jgi:bifunctional UDP-N-acetylglucosamine pyrophosphorylase/glucosamine-1-phosphate N-acetyltransferase